MQATLQGEDGQTQIVMVNLAPGTVLTDEDGNVSVTSGVTDGVISMTSAGNEHEVITESTDTISVSTGEDGQAHAIPVAIQATGDDVTYVTEETESQEVAMATAQMQAVTEQMDAETEGEISQQVVTTEEAAVSEEGPVTLTFSDISHTLTTV